VPTQQSPVEPNSSFYPIEPSITPVEPNAYPLPIPVYPI